MAEEKRGEGEAGSQGSGAASARLENETGDPGRTPGTAEGDRETVEEDLRKREAEKE